MNGTEAMNRVVGKPEEKGPGRTGRPSKPHQPAIDRLKLNVDPANPAATALALSEDDDKKWLAGSVLQILFPSGELQSVVLMDNVRVVPWFE